MRKWKMQYEQNCRGRKCRSKWYGTPNQYYIDKILSYVELENAGADRMAHMTINDKNCNIPIVLTAMDKNCKNHIKVILPTITSSKCQRDAE